MCQEEARPKVLEYEKRQHEMVATFDLLEHRIRCEEENALVSKSRVEQDRRSASSQISQYQAMINSYQTKMSTDSQNEENIIRGLCERLETEDVFLSRPQPEDRIHLIHLMTMMATTTRRNHLKRKMMEVIATGDHHGGKG